MPHSAQLALHSAAPTSSSIHPFTYSVKECSDPAASLTGNPALTRSSQFPSSQAFTCPRPQTTPTCVGRALEPLLVGGGLRGGQHLHKGLAAKAAAGRAKAAGQA
jgi:hypothetical protein